MSPKGSDRNDHDMSMTAAMSSRERSHAQAPGTVGLALQERREDLGWDLSAIAAALYIKPEYLRALEQSEIEALPGPAYAIGFLKAYGEFLGLDGAEIVKAFKRERANLPVQPELNFPMPLTDRGIPGSSLIMMAVLLFAIGYGAWVWYSSGPRTSVAAVEPVPARLLPPPTLDPPAVSPDSAAAAELRATAAVATDASGAAGSAPVVLPASGSNSAVVSQPGGMAQANVQVVRGSQAPMTTQVAAVPPAPSDQSSHVFGSPVPGQVSVKATADSWVEVLDNDHQVWTRLMKAGDVYNPPKDGLVLRTGNAGALEITVGGKVVPPIGGLGEVKRIGLDPTKLARG